jgi:predicted CXXCH cytochrome family protein
MKRPVPRLRFSATLCPAKQGVFLSRDYRQLAVALALTAGLGSSLFLLSCAAFKSGTVVAPLEIPGAHFVGNAVCAQCHAPIVRDFPASPHAGLSPANLSLPGGASCEACHGPGSKHVEAGGDDQFIINPGRSPEACLRCHLATRTEFQLPVHHPVLEGRMSCADCHDPHGGDIYQPVGGLAMARQNENCARCHREQTRPSVFEHPALREGCTVCHNPHGSINRALLTQADDNLCLRCHAQTQGTAGAVYIGSIDHTSFLPMGACWSCHTAVHGSDVDPRLRY